VYVRVCSIERCCDYKKKEENRDESIKEEKKRRNEITLFLVFYIPLFIINFNKLLPVCSFIFTFLFLFSYTHLKYDYEYKRIKESKVGILLLIHSAILSQVILLLIDVSISTVNITIFPYVALLY